MFKGLLRDEGRSGTVVPVGIAVTVVVELDRAVDEVEERRAAEVIIAAPTVLVTGAVDVQLLPINEPLGMRQEHAPHDERPEAELVPSIDRAHQPDGPTAMGETELRRDEQKVALLLLPDHLERDSRPLGEPEVRGAQLAFLPVVDEGSRLVDQVENFPDGLFVGLGDLLPPRNGEPSLGAGRQSRQLLGTGQHRTGVQTREVLGELHELFADRLHGVPLRIAVVGLHRFVGGKHTRREETCRGHVPGLDWNSPVSRHRGNLHLQSALRENLAAGLFSTVPNTPT